MKLTVSEAFFSLQGEGVTSGYPALFIRFPKCNLHCSWCDTQEVMKVTKEIDLVELIETQYFDRIVFTGGEPMLYQDLMKQIMIAVKIYFPLRQFSYEIETNGTIEPGEWFLGKGIQFNISPKLSNSDIIKERRQVGTAIVSMLHESKSYIKFVLSNPSDLIEIREDFNYLFNPKFKHKIIFMPVGKTKEELEKIAPQIAELCIKEGIKFSNRQQIILWNTKKGV